MDSYTYKKELDFAKQIAKNSGDIMLDYFKKDITHIEIKSDNTVLTKADVEISSFVIDSINSKFPDHDILGEEGSLSKESTEFIWVFDPIDGTLPFSLKIPVSTFSISLVGKDNGQPIICVIYDPFTENMFYACKGFGAYKNDQKISVSNEALNETSIVFGYKDAMSFVKYKQLEIEVWGFHSSIYSSLHIAMGNAVFTI